MKQEPFELFRAWIDSNHCCCCNKFIILNYYFLPFSCAHSCLFNVFFYYFFSSPLHSAKAFKLSQVWVLPDFPLPASFQHFAPGGVIGFSWNILLPLDLSNSWWLAWAKYQEKPCPCPCRRAELLPEERAAPFQLTFVFSRPSFLLRAFPFFFPFKSCK